MIKTGLRSAPGAFATERSFKPIHLGITASSKIRLGADAGTVQPECHLWPPPSDSRRSVVVASVKLSGGIVNDNEDKCRWLLRIVSVIELLYRLKYNR
jgi:hypothetical protein